MCVRPTIPAALFALTLLCGLSAAGPASGQQQAQQQAPQQRDARLAKNLDGVGIDERLGERIPTDLVFRDETGKEVRLGDYLGRERPVLLNLVYHNCPMLCNLVLDGMSAALREMSWTAGEEFEIVTVSFSADEGPDMAARQKAHYVEMVGRPAAAGGWHFLTGEEASIMALADAVGFSFKWVEEQETYAHPAALLFVAPDGTITRYLYGLEYAPRDVRNALVEASEGTVGTPLDQVLLYCFQYDPKANTYVLQATNLMKAGGLATTLILGALLGIFWLRESRRQREAAA